jgi:hypothetical protein
MKPQRFEALVGFGRHPAAKLINPELEWFCTKDEILLGVINIDVFDEDFFAGVLARDGDGRYRLVSNESSIPSISHARAVLTRLARKALQDGPQSFTQGDESGKKRKDIFEPLGGKTLHPSFKILKDFAGHSSARGLIAEMMHHYVDVDGNFIEQFQTTGFDSRVWELYLFAYLNEEGLLIERPDPAPDFIVRRGETKAAVEAVTVNRSQSKPEPGSAAKREGSSDEVEKLLKDFMPIKFGSPLYSKLKKRYWELEHVKGLPLVFAIADFHDAGSMTWSSTALLRYLYGVHHDFAFDETGQLAISPLKIEKHAFDGKEIPSGFFFLPDAENISAVLFSASGTISKFNRLGKIAGFGHKSVRMVRIGTNHRHDPNAALPDQFVFEIDEDYLETWAEGVSIYHNPNALIPLPRELFPSAAHHRFKDGQIVSTLPEFHPYASVTTIFVPKELRTAEQDTFAADLSKDAKDDTENPSK